MTNNVSESVWHQSVVSWGQFVVALLTATMVIGGFLLSNERRITQIESAAQFQSVQVAQLQATDAVVAAKLDAIHATLQAILITLARTDAENKALLDLHNGKPGVKIPQK